MKTVEQQVKDKCEQLGCEFIEHQDSHLIVTTGDKRMWGNDSHDIYAHIETWQKNPTARRNDALRFILDEMAAGLHSSEGGCADGDDCEYCGDEA